MLGIRRTDPGIPKTAALDEQLLSGHGPGPGLQPRHREPAIADISTRIRLLESVLDSLTDLDIPRKELQVLAQLGGILLLRSQ